MACYPAEAFSKGICQKTNRNGRPAPLYLAGAYPTRSPGGFGSRSGIPNGQMETHPALRPSQIERPGRLPASTLRLKRGNDGPLAVCPWLTPALGSRGQLRAEPATTNWLELFSPMVFFHSYLNREMQSLEFAV
ncbi:uncharacterized protein CLUP02_09552 [Colletotrichum lupini]|uniref:Uncharacterized protein n=1 Tax=Colletotrichum lupini TaxID=145971 RepID=A0A9Q8SWI7_9PEZI|nr:uncharacterized protein CLUP02_09552 [Colletotrichum lupini]UQC84056.1 hypothetical protein CLUP02_09552 [Colletotrichum lupini]